MTAPQPSTLLRRLSIALLGIAPLAADAAQITVNDAGTVLQALDGRCTLREAMRAANNDTASGSAAGECAAGNGPDVILLAASTALYTLTIVDNTNLGANGLPIVASSITIEGNGATLQRSGAAGTPDFRLFEVAPNGTLTLRNIHLRNGRASNGGAVFNNVGQVVLEGSEVSASVATCDGGGIFSFGGGLSIEQDSALHDNVAGCSGGAVFAREGSISIFDSALVANVSSSGGGGGVMLFDTPNAVLFRATVDGNTAVLDGGGVLTHGAATNTQIVESVIVNNRCEPLPTDSIGGNGGGIANGRTNNQGGVTPFVAGGIMRIVASTISNNVGAKNAAQLSSPFGGGIANVGQLTIERSRIVQNTAVEGRGGGISTMDITGAPSGFVLRDSVVEGNTVGGGQGGGIISFGNTTIERTLLRANIGGNGGGILVRTPGGAGIGGTTRIFASVITGNSGSIGSAIQVGGGPDETVVTSSTISGNTVTSGQFGGGAVFATSPLELNGVTLVDNRGGRGGLYNSNTVVGVYNTIVVGNRDYTDAFVDCFANGAAPTWQGAYSLVGEGTGCGVIVGPGMRTLTPLQLFIAVVGALSNDTTLPAHIPLRGSIALDAGDPVPASAGSPSGCPSFDQLGRARPQDEDGDGVVACDIGAVEGITDIFSDGFEDPT